ncbi:MAG: BamA/TamA family outer membrane protein [Bacteroidales bacterium]|nr:BamA/TamA family outer membrane protein [Bacteroidales bacterium]
MKRLITIALLLAAVCTASAQEEIKKTGLNFGPLPAVSYSSDLGFQYGALLDIYQYGDGSFYPDYKWKINVETSWYTKGNSVYHVFFDSKHLIPGLRVSADLTYLGNKTTNFYGYNGAAALFIPELNKIVDGQGLYMMRRDDFRFEFTTQGQFGDSHWGWVAGLAFNSYKTGHAVNKNLNAAVDLSLYDIYLKHDIIPAAEANGGNHLDIKLGVVFDTRDHENNPTRGTNLEAFFFGSPDFLNGKRDYRNDYLKLAIHFRQFFPLADRLVFAGHLAFQGLIAGNAPFYSLQTIQPINRKIIITDGLGSISSVRGTVVNRLQGNSYAWANFELRWSFAKFRWINQNWAIALNPFFDMGMIVAPYRLEQMKSLLQDDTRVATVGNKVYTVADLYTQQAEKLHMSAGAGLHVIMNQNFNIACELGKCFSQSDGTGLGMRIGLNYLF